MRQRLLLLAVAPLLGSCASPGPHLDRAAKPEEAKAHGHYLTLYSGLRIVAYQLQGAQSVSILTAYTLAGLDDPEGKEGLRRVASRVGNSAVVAQGGFRAMERFFAAGALYGETVNADELSWWVRVRPERVREALAVEVERVRNPVAGLGDADIASARETFASSLEDDDSDGRRLASLWARAFPGTPYARPWPTAASVRSITNEDVRRLLRSAVRPERGVVVVVGPNPALQTAEEVARAFGIGDPKTPVEPVELEPAPSLPVESDPKIESLPAHRLHPELWVAWPLPGIRSLTAAKAQATALAVQFGSVLRLSGDDVSGQFRWVDVRVEMRESAAMLVVRGGLKDDVDVGEARDTIVKKVSGMASVWTWQPMVLSILTQPMSSEGFVGLERGKVRDVVELVRGADRPDAIGEWNRQVSALPTELRPYMQLNLVPGRAVALHVPPSQDPDAPDQPQEIVKELERASSLLGAAAPGAGEIGRLVASPGLAGAERRTLPNGLTVVVLPRGAFPTVEVALHVATDSESPDPQAEKALAVAVGPGTVKCNAPKAKLVPGGVVASVRGPAAFLPRFLDEVACWTEIDPTRFELGRTLDVLNDAERRYEGGAADVALTLLHVMGGPPSMPVVVHPAFGSVDRVAAAQRFTGWFRPKRATLVIAGRLTPSEALWNDVNHAFGRWVASTPALDEPAPGPGPDRRRVLLLDYPAAKRGYALVLYRVPPRGARDEGASRVMLAHLGERVGSLAFPVGAEGFAARFDGARLPIDVLAFNGKVSEIPAAVRGILLDVDRLGARALDGPALDFARWKTAVATAYAHDDLSDVVAEIGTLALRGLPADAAEGAGADLAAVTADRVQAFASSVHGRELVVVAGPASALRPALEKIGISPEVIEVPGEKERAEARAKEKEKAKK